MAAPGVDFGDASPKSFLKLAQTFEDTGVSAYNGAAPALSRRPSSRPPAASCRWKRVHAAAIRQLNGVPITDGGFDKSLDMAQVLMAVKPFVKA